VELGTIRLRGHRLCSLLSKSLRTAFFARRASTKRYPKFE
jgi:hypothetical protein